MEREAEKGEAARFRFPRPLLDRPGCDMSFSGLKTAVLRARDALISEKNGFQGRTEPIYARAFKRPSRTCWQKKRGERWTSTWPKPPKRRHWPWPGGVAANRTIRTKLEAVSYETGVGFVAPPLSLCTDNAAMIAYAGIELYRAGHRDGLDLAARPRWPLDRSSPAMLGSGKKGAKA